MMSVILSGTISMGSGPAAAADRAPRPERLELENGLRLLVIPQPHLPMVVAYAVIDSGSRFDPVGGEGLASLTADLLTEGSEGRTAAEVHDTIDFLGARLSAGAGDDYATLSLTVLRKDLETGLDLFADALRRPAFAPEVFERKRDEALAELEADEQNPGSVADNEFRKALFGAGPYRNASGGWREAVSALKVADVRAFHTAAYRPERTILVVSGDVTPENARALVTERFGDWQRGKAEPAVPPSSPASAAAVVKVERDLTQANLVFGHLGTTREDPDWYAIQVMNYILGGGGFSSRLMMSIRVEAGLAYSVYSYFRPGKLLGTFQVGLQTKSASTGHAIELLRKEIDRIRTEPVSEQELGDAKKYLTGSFPLKFDSNAEMVSFYAQVEYYDLGLDYASRYEALINGVTAADVKRVAVEYLKPDRGILVVVGRQDDIEIPGS